MDSSAPKMASSETNDDLVKKKRCPHYKPGWDTHPFCRLCRSRRAKGVKYCNWDDPCDICSNWSDDTWQKSDDSIKKKIAQDIKKDRSRSTSDSSKSVSVAVKSKSPKDKKKKPEISLPFSDKNPARPKFPAKIPPPPPLQIAPSIFSGKIVRLNEGNSSKCPARDHGSDIPTLFTHRPVYKPKTTNITPVPSKHETDDEEDPERESALSRQSRFDRLEAERQFKHELELAKLASLGI